MELNSCHSSKLRLLQRRAPAQPKLAATTPWKKVESLLPTRRRILDQEIPHALPKVRLQVLATTDRF
jgi:hypothetical protein